MPTVAGTWQHLIADRQGEEITGVTSRLDVPGGSLYRCASCVPFDPGDHEDEPDWTPTFTAIAMTFVPGK